MKYLSFFILSWSLMAQINLFNSNDICSDATISIDWTHPVNRIHQDADILKKLRPKGIKKLYQRNMQADKFMAIHGYVQTEGKVRFINTDMNNLIFTITEEGRTRYQELFIYALPRQRLILDKDN